MPCIANALTGCEKIFLGVVIAWKGRNGEIKSIRRQAKKGNAAPRKERRQEKYRVKN